MSNIPTNEDRAGWAQVAVDAFAAETNMDAAGEDMQTVMGDLLADLMHLCQQNDIDFERILATGKMHFEAELEEEKVS